MAGPGNPASGKKQDPPMDADRTSVRLSLRGIGAWLVTAYLTELGGQEMEPGLVVGDGWQVRVAAGEPVNIGAIRLGVTGVEFSGPAAAIAAARAAFEKKALRAGG